MALTPEEKLKLNMLLAESEADLAEAAAIDKPTTAKELLDVFGTAVGQSASMNLLDELVAAGSDTTAEERAEANRMIEAERNRTLGTAAAGLAGDIVGAVPGGISAARIAGTKALRLLGLGAAEGAISGAGAGETPEERLSGAAIGAGLGAGAAGAGVAAPKIARALSSQKQMTEAIEQLAKETAEAQQRKLASIRGTKQLEKEAKPTRFKVKDEEPKKFKVEKEEPGELIELEEPTLPTSGAKTAIPAIIPEKAAPTLDETARLAIDRLLADPETSTLVGQSVKRRGLPLEESKPITAAEASEQYKKMLDETYAAQLSKIPAEFADVPIDVYLQAKKLTDELVKLGESRGKVYSKSNIDDQLRRKIKQVQEQKGSAGAMRAKPKTESEKAGQTEMFSDTEMSGVLPEELAELGLQNIRRISDLDPSVFPGLIKSTKTLIAKKEKELKSKELTKAQLDDIRDEIKQYKADIFEMENALKATRKQPETAAELAKDIAQLGFEQMKSGKPRGMAILPFGGKRKLKQLPEKTETSQTTAMVPSLSKQEMEVAARGPSITERLGKAGRSLQGSLTVDEFRAERKILEDELSFAQQKLDLASTDAEVRAAERAQNAAYQKLDRFREDYPDIDDLMQLVNDLDRKRNAINTRFSRGDHLLGEKAANALTIDVEKITLDEVRAAEKIRDVFLRYPELYYEIPRSHPLMRAYEDLPDLEIPAFTESRSVMRRLEEMLGIKKR